MPADMIFKRLSLFIAALVFSVAGFAADMPQLRTQGTATQLIVDGKPLLILGGELGNSTASDLKHLQTHWKTLKSIGLNTVIAPVQWDQTERSEGSFDFRVVDGLVQQAQANGMKLVLLWFGVWKNSMSTYVPPYVKRNFEKYARAQDDRGAPQDILSAFDPDTLAADQRVFAALMAHLKATDKQHTVVMVQVENEIGMLPTARDHSPQANAAWAQPVPPALLNYMARNLAQLHPSLRERWKQNGQRSAGTWAEVFGIDLGAQEIFQAWHFAVFSNELTKAGKAAYALPMYVNAALNRPGRKPGEYPSGGPLPHLFDVWKAAAPAIDLLGLDIYSPDFNNWATQFKRADNPLFIPEANQAGLREAGGNAFFAIGQLDAIGFSPFSIEDLTDAATHPLTQAYATLQAMAPLILAHQGKGTMRGFRAPMAYDGSVDTATPQSFELGGYRFKATMLDPWTPKEKQEVAGHGGLIVQTGPDDFIVAGKGVTLTFEDLAPGGFQVGMETVIEGRFMNGQFEEGRWLNGDQTHQGRHLRLPPERYTVQRLRLYRYK
jgi:beta-galactosidase GanA